MTSAHPGLDTTYKKEAVMKMQQEAARNYHTAGVLLGLATMTISFDPRSDGGHAGGRIGVRASTCHFDTM